MFKKIDSIGNDNSYLRTLLGISSHCDIYNDLTLKK